MHELPQKPQLIPFKHKRFFEICNTKVRIFGRCEVTDNDFEMFVPIDQFYCFLQEDKTISDAMPDVSKEEREFLLTGTSPDGWKQLWGK